MSFEIVFNVASVTLTRTVKFDCVVGTRIWFTVICRWHVSPGGLVGVAVGVAVAVAVGVGVSGGVGVPAFQKELKGSPAPPLYNCPTSA